jgi:hypothetical protein
LQIHKTNAFFILIRKQNISLKRIGRCCFQLSAVRPIISGGI